MKDLLQGWVDDERKSKKVAAFASMTLACCLAALMGIAVVIGADNYVQSIEKHEVVSR